VDTLGIRAQHEFAFGFCGSIGVEISRVRKKWIAAGSVHQGWKKPMVFKLEICFFGFYGFLMFFFWFFRFKSRKPKIA